MSAVTDFGFAPFVGCVVNHDPSDVSRITRSHPATWIDVVLNRDTLDWAGSAATVRDRSAGTLVVVAPADHEAMTASIERLVASTDTSAAQILVVDNGLDLMPSQVLASLGWRHPRVRVVPAPSDRGWAVALNLGMLAASTELVVLVDPLAVPGPDWLPPLLAALQAEDVLGAQPSGLGESIGGQGPEVLSWGACALRAADLVPLLGLDPLIRPELAMADLSRRLAGARAGHFAVASASTVAMPTTGLHPPSRHPELDQLAADTEGRQIFLERWGPAALDRALSMLG